MVVLTVEWGQETHGADERDGKARGRPGPHSPCLPSLTLISDFTLPHRVSTVKTLEQPFLKNNTPEFCIPRKIFISLSIILYVTVSITQVSELCKHMVMYARRSGDQNLIVRDTGPEKGVAGRGA